MKTARQIDHKKISHTVFIISCRTTLFLFLFTLTLFALFTAGNYQDFTDSELRTIISITSIAGILLFLIATLTALNAVARCILHTGEPHRFRPLIYALILFPAGVIGLALSIFSGFLSFLTLSM